MTFYLFILEGKLWALRTKEMFLAYLEDQVNAGHIKARFRN